MADCKQPYGWNHDERPGADAEPPVTTTYPRGRTRTGGPKAPSSQRAVISIIALSGVIALIAAVGGILASRSKTVEETPTHGGPQAGPAPRPAAGETETPGRPSQRGRRGLAAPDAGHGVTGSARVDLTDVKVAGGGRERTPARVRKVLDSGYRNIVTTYLNVARASGETSRKDTVVVRFRLTPAGKAENFDILMNTTSSRDLDVAMQALLASYQFPPAREDATVTAVYSFEARLPGGGARARPDEP